MKCSIFFIVIFNFYLFVYCDEPPINHTINRLLFTNNSFNESLSERTLKLKKQALKLMKLRGMEVDTEIQYDVSNDSDPIWGDIQVTESFYSVLKKSFDDEELELNKTSDYENDRMSAPDFRIIPFAKWSSMPIPYTVHLIRNSELIDIVDRAVDEIQRRTCIRFQKVSNANGPHIEFAEVHDLPQGVCASSPLGKESSKNTIKIAPTCKYVVVIVHEICHSLGFAHTQSRPDANKYLIFYWDNVHKDMQFNFKPFNYGMRNQGPYDYGSIMHYSWNAFAINRGRPTMWPRYDPEKNYRLMGSAKQMTSEDGRILNKVYCSDEQLDTSCSDSSKSCDYWKSQNYCNPNSQYADYVRERCRWSCSICKLTAQCSDSNEHCPSWAKRGYCNHYKYFRYMRANCRASCGLCD